MTPPHSPVSSTHRGAAWPASTARQLDMSSGDSPGSIARSAHVRRIGRASKLLAQRGGRGLEESEDMGTHTA